MLASWYNKKNSWFTIILFVSLLVTSTYALDPDQSEKSDDLMKAGIRLLKDGEYEKAAEEFLRVASFIKNKKSRANLYQLLSLAYFKLGDREKCENYIREMFEQNPGQKIPEQEYDREYVNIYNKVKAEYWFGIKNKSEEEQESEQKIIEKLAQKPEKGKNKLVRILVLAGIVVTVGVVAAVILGLGNKDQTIQDATSGVIRLVNLSSVTVWYSVLDIQDILYANQVRLVTVPEGNYTVRFFDDDHSETQTVIVLAGTETYVFFRGWDEFIKVQQNQQKPAG